MKYNNYKINNNIFNKINSYFVIKNKLTKINKMT